MLARKTSGRSSSSRNAPWPCLDRLVVLLEGPIAFLHPADDNDVVDDGLEAAHRRAVVQRKQIDRLDGRRFGVAVAVSDRHTRAQSGDRALDRDAGQRNRRARLVTREEPRRRQAESGDVRHGVPRPSRGRRPRCAPDGGHTTRRVHEARPSTAAARPGRGVPHRGRGAGVSRARERSTGDGRAIWPAPTGAPAGGVPCVSARRISSSDCPASCSAFTRSNWARCSRP